jgi:S-adenosylmethionine decarboxylase
MKTIGTNKLYGKELLLDLKDCNPKTLRSGVKIRQFAKEICRVINMKPFGKPFVARFGLGKDFTAGYSMVQLIETSSITGHFSELWNQIHLNIFSCTDYDAQKAAAFCKKYFGAKKVRARVLIR